MKFMRLAAVAAAFVPSLAFAGGFAHNQNFIVNTPDQATRTEDQRFAEVVLERAEAYRSEIAKQWLGAELPAGAGQTVVYVKFSAAEDHGLTWAKDHPNRKLHTIWVTTSPRLAVGETLKHEIAHTIFATKFPHPNRLPSWLEEGIASRYDDPTRQSVRDQLIRSWVRTGRTANLATVLDSPNLRSFDEDSYAAATSLVSYLLTRGDEQTLLQFGIIGGSGNWDAALATHYGIQSVQQLQTLWQNWLAKQLKTVA